MVAQGLCEDFREANGISEFTCLKKGFRDEQKDEYLKAHLIDWAPSAGELLVCQRASPSEQESVLRSFYKAYVEGLCASDAKCIAESERILDTYHAAALSEGCAE